MTTNSTGRSDESARTSQIQRPESVLLTRITELEDQVYDIEQELRDLKLAIQQPLAVPVSWRLRRMEHKYLELFHSATGIVPVAMIYQICYGSRINPPGEETIKTTIHNLRRKIKPFNITILNHHSQGYYMPQSSKETLNHYLENSYA